MFHAFALMNLQAKAFEPVHQIFQLCRAVLFFQYDDHENSSDEDKKVKKASAAFAAEALISKEDCAQRCAEVSETCSLVKRQ